MKLRWAGFVALFFNASVFAQPPRGREGPPPPRRPPIERELGGPPGRWWGDVQLAQKIGLSSEQQKKMDDIFQQHRVRLIDASATLEKEEAAMEPLVSADTPDEVRILAQIDRVAQARAELEKANARMLLGIRKVLTHDQWQKLRAEAPPPRPDRRGPPPDDRGREE